LLPSISDPRTVLAAVLRALHGEGVPRLESMVQEGHPVLAVMDSSRNTLLLMAAKLGKLPVLEWLCSRSALDTTDRNSELQTCLHVACAAGHQQTTEWLVEKDPMLVNKIDKAGQTALHAAAAAGKRGVCSLLVEAGADLEAHDARKDTPLLLVASRDRDMAMLQHLVHLRADPNARVSRIVASSFAFADLISMMAVWCVARTAPVTSPAHLEGWHAGGPILAPLAVAATLTVRCRC
jgi:hypothetical protein